MTRHTISYPSSDNRTAIHAVCWMPEGQPRAVIQIAHGMMEYIERYERFAEYMTGMGFLVAGHDHLGHGASVTAPENWGYFAERHGDGCLLRDMHRLRRIVQQDHPGIPYFMLGHSMGSYLLRAYIVRFGEGLAGAILVGTGYVPDHVAKVGLKMTETLAQTHGWRHRSRLTERLFFFGPFSRFDMTGERPDRSWLTKDKDIVRDFYGDERCTFKFTLNAYDNFLRIILYGNRPENLAQIPKRLPVLLASGTDDPVGNFGKGVRAVGSRLLGAGLDDVTVKLYEGDRHELLNELDRERVYDYLAAWCEARMPSESPA